MAEKEEKGFWSACLKFVLEEDSLTAVADPQKDDPSDGSAREEDSSSTLGAVTDMRDPGYISEAEELLGWHRAPHRPSLHEVNSSIRVPGPSAPWWKKLFAFSGLGFVISVGYMDPGNWATGLSAGASYGYTLLCVILFSNFAAMFLQHLSLKLGVVGERDLAQACRDAYPKWAIYPLWVLAEIAIAATDLAEVIGSATALYLLFGLPLWAGVIITALDVLFIMAFGMKNFRFLEILIVALVALIASCYVYELIAVEPNWLSVAKGFIPKGEIVTNPDILYNAIGILGATVMPHNLYLHSSIVQTRAYSRTYSGKHMAVKYGTLDSSFSLSIALFVNASILILASAAFHTHNGQEVAYISDAYKLLSPAVGSKAAKYIFGIALLACGQNSTITGTLAGQIVMEGFLHIRLKPWARRMATRGVALIPAAIVAGVLGNSGAGKLLVMSQVILSLQLPFCVAPLVQFTSSRGRMGKFVNGWVSFCIAILLTIMIIGLNGFLIIQSIRTNHFGTTTSV